MAASHMAARWRNAGDGLSSPWHNALMAKQRKVAREIMLSLAAAAVFGYLLYAYIDSSIPRLQAPLLVSSAAPEPGPSDLQLARAVTNNFIGALHAGRYEAAYALMASSYRESYSPGEFRARCAASPFLATAERVVLSRTRRVVPPGAAARTASVQGSGVLASGTTSIEAHFTLLPEADAGLRIVVLSIAGVVVLDGVSGREPTR